MLSHLLAAAVGAVIAVAGATKVIGYSGWREDARRQGVWMIVAVPLPVVELVLGCFLVVLSPVPVTLGAATLLLVVFTAFLVVQVMTKSTVPCACFGARSRRAPSMRDVVRNLVMIAALFTAAAVR